MASLILGGNTYVQSVFPRETYSVWVKREWGDAWYRVPYMIPKNWQESAAPSTGQARVRWEYGNYVNKWYHAGGTLLPLDIEDWCIAIVVHSIYGNRISFIGVVVGESMRDEGTDGQAFYPTGYQEFECRDLKYLLERRRVLGTFVGDNSGWVYLPRTRPFNTGYSMYEGRLLNRSDQRNDDANCYLFEENGSAWSNFDIIEYLLGCFQPWYPTGVTAGGAVSLTPLFYVVGQTEPLEHIYGEYRFWGKSVFECLDILIDRRRGFGWKLATDGVNAIYIVVYSLSENEIWGDNAYIPANPSQHYVNVGDSHHITARYQITSTRRVDEIVVESDEPVKVMATLRYADASLERGFTVFNIDSYNEATEEERASDTWAHVFSRHQVPNNFDFSSMIPLVDDFGVVDVNSSGAYWNYDYYFERYLPIEEETWVDEVEYIEPFALIAKPDRQRDLATQLADDGNAPYTFGEASGATSPAMTQEEFDTMSTDDESITAGDITTALARPKTYIHLDRTQQFGYPACGLQLANKSLGVYITSEAPHVFGMNHFTGDSEIDPVFDYETLLVTVFFRTDEMPRVRLPVFAGSYVDFNGNVVNETNPQGKQIHIVVPGQEIWTAAPNTVTGVDENGLVYFNNAFAGGLRDDSNRIWWTALVAYIWYGQQRAAAEFTIENNLPWFEVGDLVRATVSGFWWERIGTVVTSITHDCESGSQIIRTAYGEMDPAVFAEDGDPT